MSEGSNTAATTFAQGQLRAYVERIERLEEEKKAIADDIKEVFAEAKGNGFDVPALREVLKIRKEDAQKRAEREAILETYLHALGMLADTPLGDAAVARDFADTKVTITSAAGSVETTAGGIQRAADALGRRHARSGKALTPAQVQAAADRAEARHEP